MSAALTLSGELVSIGDMPADEVTQIAGVPHFLLQMDGDRALLISGLTRDECKALDSAFLHTVRVSFEVDA